MAQFEMLEGNKAKLTIEIGADAFTETPEDLEIVHPG